MRKRFFKLIHELMAKDKDIFFLTGNLGYGGIDLIRKDYPDRFLDCGAAEQAMIGIAVGLARSGKKPFCYSITPFLIWRPAEFIRNYIDHEKIPVCLIGSGRNQDYKTEGWSHDAGDDFQMVLNGNLASYWPDTIEEMEKLVDLFLQPPSEPMYINLKR
jgi:transketolase